MRIDDGALKRFTEEDRMIHKIYFILKTRGVHGLLYAIKSRFVKPRANCFRMYADLFSGRFGIEIGGPSSVFARDGIFPVYPIVGGVDSCNFGSHTIWEGKVIEGETFLYDRKRTRGHQYIAEAVDLGALSSDTYDFLLSSHVIEHTANPLKALAEWRRVLKVGGIMVIVVPHKDGTFDHRRSVTSLDHLIHDFEDNIGEDDLTHLPEILALHDLGRDPDAGRFSEFKRRSEENFHHRGLHHHAFDTELAIRTVDHAGFQIRAVEPLLPYHIFVVAEKLSIGHLPKNSAFLSQQSEIYTKSPFSSDRSADRLVATSSPRSL